MTTLLIVALIVVAEALLDGFNRGRIYRQGRK